jgi:phosphoribosylanthranilate isomerase
MVRVKICGITNLDDAFAALDYGADALGFVFYAKSPRSISLDKAKNIISSLPPFVTTVGVFVDIEKTEVEEHASYVGVDIIQLHGSESPEYCNHFANKKVIKAIRIKELSDLEPLSRYKTASAFLLDTYAPKEAGGTGRIFNWEIAIEAKTSGRIILAGGLTAENIEEAIRFVQPYGVDVSSGVEGSQKGKKDHKKLRSFIEKAKSAALKYYS